MFNNATRYLCPVIFAALASSCNATKDCEPNTVRVLVPCPAEYEVDRFEVTVSNNGGAPKVLDDVPATCPGTTVLTLEYKNYAALTSVSVSVTPVDKSGVRRPALVREFGIVSTCVRIDLGVISGQADAGTGGGSDASTPTPVDAPTDGHIDGTSAACVQGDKRCNDKVPETCVTGTWIPGEACTYVCKGGVCGGECKPDTKSCQSGIPVSCTSDGTLSHGAVCPNICKDGDCVGACSPGTRQCGTNNTPALCDNSGTWKSEAPCQTMCLDGFCKGCKQGTAMCNGATLFTCDANGDWIKGETCPYVCDATAGKCTGTCKPTAARCGANETPEICDQSGTWKSTAQQCPFVCKDGQCGGECKPTTAVCGAGGAPMVCNSQGVWVPGNACPFVCKDGACIGTCNPGEMRCNPAGGMVQTCGTNGTWGADSACPARQSCSGAGVCTCNAPPSGCSTVGSFCTSAGIISCAADANGCIYQTSLTPCPNGCMTAAACNECAPSTDKRCTASGESQLCGPDGKWQTPAACQFVCTGGSCSGVCVPNKTQCGAVSGVPEVCSTSGQWTAQDACGFRCIGNGACEDISAGQYSGTQQSGAAIKFTVDTSGRFVTQLIIAVPLPPCTQPFIQTQTFLVNWPITTGKFSGSLGTCPKIEITGQFGGVNYGDGTVKYTPEAGCSACAATLTWRANKP